jgi:hypothetical protein
MNRRIFGSTIAAAAVALTAFAALQSGGTGGGTPTPTPTPCTQHVAASDTTGFAGALNSASDGAVVCLDGGSYGYVTQSNKNRSSYTTFRPNPGASVTLAGMQLTNYAYARFDGFTFSGGTNILASDHLEFIGNTVSDATNGFLLRGVKNSL